MDILTLIFIGLLIIIIIPLLIIGLIVFFIIRGSKRRIKKEVKERAWYLQFFLSKEDIIRQFFFLFSVFFLVFTLLAFNKDLGDPLSWQTILLLGTLAGLVIGYYFKAIYALAVSLIGLMSWWGFQAREWGLERDIKNAAVLAGILFIALIFYLLGRAHEKEIKFKRVSIIYSILGLIPITGVLFFLSTKFGLRTLETLTKGVSLFSSWEITLSLFIFLIFLIGILIYNLSKNLIFKSEAIVIGFLAALFWAIALMPEQTMWLEQNNYYTLSSTGILWAAIFNILVLIEILGLIILGYIKKESWLKKLGLLFIGLLFLVKLIGGWDYWGENSLLFSIGILIFLTSILMVYFLIKFLEKNVNLQIWDKIYSILGIVPLTFFLLLLSSKSGLERLDFDIKNLSFFSELLIVSSVYLVFNLGLWIYFFKNKINFLKEISFLVGFVVLLVLIILLGPHKNLFIDPHNLSSLGIFWAIVLNIMVFFQILGILFLGYLNKKHLFINLSVLFFFILIFIKYFDWFFAFLDKSIFFIGAGILLLVVGWFMEKGRRYLLSTINK